MRLILPSYSNPKTMTEIKLPIEFVARMPNGGAAGVRGDPLFMARSSLGLSLLFHKLNDPEKGKAGKEKPLV